MDTPILKDILVIFALSIFVLLGCHRLKIPSVVGFLLTGLIAGPGGLGLVKGVEDVEKLSHIGIIFLLFTVGLEFSLKKILEYKRYFLIGGGVQVGLTVLLGFLVSYFWGRPTGEALFLGFLLSLSSTAIVLKVVQEKGESSTPHGRAIVGILIFQDVVAIPMMLLIPMLGSGESMEWGWDLAIKGATGLILLVGVFWSAIYLMPRLLDLVSRTRNRELFLLTVLVACFSVAWITAQLNLSLSIGAFLAGLIISDSEYSTEAIGDMLPFRDLFMSFFFISIGMLSHIGFILQHPFLLLVLSIGIVFAKAVISTFAVVGLGLPLRTAVISGMALAQIGEFSFVLAKSGFNIGLGTPFLYQLFLDVSLITMALTPFMISLSDKVASTLLKLPLPVYIKTGFRPEKSTSLPELKNHVIIVGFGIAGRNLARVLKETSIPYVILEMNSETVKSEKKRGEPIYYGDATHESVLKHAGIGQARALSLVINDPEATIRIVEVARKYNPSLYIIARTRRNGEVPILARLGASDVIPDEFGTSVEIFTRILRLFQIPSEMADKFTQAFRHEGYDVLRKHIADPSGGFALGGVLQSLKMDTYIIEQGSLFMDKSLKDSDIRNKAGLTVMMIRRGEEVIADIDPSFVLKALDKVTVYGSQEKVAEAKRFFKA